MGKRNILREGNKEETVASVAAEVCSRIRTLGVGKEVSISQIVREIYLEKGYEFKCAKSGLGWVWTRDDCETYSLEDSDQFEILDLVRNEFKLDFSKYNGLIVGLPYNIPFVVREKE